LGISAKLLEHDTTGRPECPERLRAIFEATRRSGFIAGPNPVEPPAIDIGPMPSAQRLRDRLVELPPASPAELRWIQTVHTSKYLRHLEHVCRHGGVLDAQGDTPVCPASYDAALLAAGIALQCCDAVMEGKARRAFAAIRPPGHHAEPNQGMGFCLLANVSIAARYLQLHHGVERVAIVDFDVHHGNGTQAVFEADPSVLFVSLHQDPRTCYPGSGFADETGVGAGIGQTLNIPLSPGTEDAEYLAAFDRLVIPKVNEFAPQMLLVSAGFDAHRSDPLASLELSDDGFAQITDRLVGLARAHCGGRLVSVLEGGYCLPALARSVIRHLMSLAAED